uniref:Uncharacterized protein n=1 Tax=Oryza nivara TaxID=4536 RepID=A0A0E0HL14_ORYNI
MGMIWLVARHIKENPCGNARARASSELVLSWLARVGLGASRRGLRGARTHQHRRQLGRPHALVTTGLIAHWLHGPIESEVSVARDLTDCTVALACGRGTLCDVSAGDQMMT